MAKKTVIPGGGEGNTPLLNNLQQPWGGIGDGSQVYGITIPAGVEWGMNRGEVERFIKAQLGAKFGDFRTTEPDENNFVHILCFASASDAAVYDEDPIAGLELVIKDLTIPISTASVDSFIGTLSTSRSTAIQYLVKDGDSFEIPLRFNATHIIAATSTQEPMSGNGTLIVERSPNGTSGWAQIRTMTIPASSETTGYPVTLDLKGLLLEGSQNYIRLRATFDYTNNEGEHKTLGTTPLILNINSVTLTLEMATAWQEPQVDPSSLAFTYTVRGMVAREFHLEVTGSAGTYETTQPITAAQTSVAFNLLEQSAYGFLTHGIKKLEAWLTAGNETTGELESEHLVVNIMVVKSSAENVMQPMLLISEMKEEVENFVQTRLLAYAVYSPAVNGDGDIVNSGPSVPMTFLLTNSANNILSSEQTVYSSLFVNPVPGTKYYLDMTVEIEQEGDTLSAFLHATRDDNGVTKDFLEESTGSGNIFVSVDNTGGFQPTAGSTFLLNPKQRNNDEANPKTILNAKNNNAVVQSTWQNFRLGLEDGYVKDDNGESCLRVPAGRLLTIQYNPLALLYRSPNSSLNMEFDVCIRNVTNEDDPILKLAEQVGGVWQGLRLLPMVGYMTTESWNSIEESDFRWQEDVRTHIAINIVNAVYPNAHGDALVTADKVSQSQGSFSLVRVFINGIINREFVYSPNSSEFCTGAMSNGGMVFGQDGADIDIYGIRIWEGTALTPEQVLQDYISTIPNSDKKRRLKAVNSIIDPNTGLIGLDYITGEGSVEGIKKNILIWHGNEPYHENAYKGETGWLEMRRYDSDGNYLPELSGKVCEATKSIPQKAQGTTAKTYYYHNIQFSIKDVTATITIAPSDLHSSITALWNAAYVWKDDDDNPTGETGAWMLKGGYLGKNFPLATESALPYHGTESSIVVPDGWIDGNGKYRGQGYQVAEGIPMAQKLVNKINYASSMQSHLIGINWLYNELHTAIVGKNKMQLDVPGAVVAKHTEPFLFFTQAEGSNRAVFRGPCAFGAGKMDKPSWGYVKSAHPDFCMIEGADNDKQLTDMRVPWDDEAHGSSPAKVFYDPEEEAFYYRIAGGSTEKCLDFDGGKTDDAGYPTSSIISYIKAAWNFLYLHAPRIRHYNGSLAEFLVDADYAKLEITADTTQAERERIELARSRVNTANKYWCRKEGVTSTGDYILKRYDYTDGEWVDAGLWNGTQYAQIDMRTDAMTASAWNALTASQKNQSELVNSVFVDAVVADARANIGSYFKVNSLKFHYCFQNHFIAGTDNCSKNTYYVLDPATHLFELHQDDVDTTLATDNSGLQSKPYYIDRMHPYAGDKAADVAMTGDIDNERILYEGYYNVLFDLIELMYEPTGELQSMMRTILSTMASLTGGVGSEESNALNGVWRSLNRYLFDIQRYFPETVYNEAARIRYELPELIGFLSDVRRVRPIKQSLGDQLQSEMQFMKRRLVYMASYAAFGEFTAVGLRGGSLTGLEGASEGFGMTPYPLPGSSSPSTYVFHLVPHQWIYPTGSRQTNNLEDPHVRVAPGATNMPDGYFPLDISVGETSDQGCTILGLNYYREIGNVGDMVANNGQANFTLNGRRLTKFVCEPTLFYTDQQLPAFRVNNIIIGTATRLKEFNVKGAVIGTGTLNLSALTVCESIDLRDTGISQVRVPETSTLQTLKLPASLTALSLTAQANLSSLTMQGYAALTQLVITGSPLVGGSVMENIVLSTREAGAQLSLLRLAHIKWPASNPVQASAIRWLLDIADNAVCELAGHDHTGEASVVPDIYIDSGIANVITFDDVARLIDHFGNIRSEQNGLYISFRTYNIDSGSVNIEGKKYINTNPSSPTYDLDENKNYNGLSVSVSGNGNDVGVTTDASGKVVPNVKWELVELQNGEWVATTSSYAEFSNIYSPVISILSVIPSGSKPTINVRVTITKTDNSTVSVVKKVGLWRRIPEVGDFAWTDGEFDNQNDLSKKLAGLVIRKTAVEVDGEIVYDLDIISAANAAFPTTVATPGLEAVWGVAAYSSSNTSGFPNGKTDGQYNEGVLEAIRQAVQSWTRPSDINYIVSTTYLSDVFDTPLVNKSDGGGILRKDSSSGSGVPMQDVNTEDGYYVQPSTTLKDFNTKEENAVLMSYANTVLKAVLQYLGISQEDYKDIRNSGGCDSEGIPLTTEGLQGIADLIVYKVGQPPYSVTNPQKYRQLLFMAARRCNVWSPADIIGALIDENKLHENYKRGKWMLPTAGLLARIFNFTGNSRSGYNTSGAISESYANEDEALKEAQLPLFSNAIARGRDVAYPHVANGQHWVSATAFHISVTEASQSFMRYIRFDAGSLDGSGTYAQKLYSGCTIRPVCVFRFVP